MLQLQSHILVMTFAIMLVPLYPSFIAFMSLNLFEQMSEIPSSTEIPR